MGEKVKKEMAKRSCCVLSPTPEPRRGCGHAAMALAALTGDEQCIIFSQLCNALDTRIAVAFGSISSELRVVTQAPRQQLRADHEVAAALCRKMAEGSCKSLCKATIVRCWSKGLSAEEWSTLGTLGSVLPAPKSILP
jgi:hypothetical protein